MSKMNWDKASQRDRIDAYYRQVATGARFQSDDVLTRDEPVRILCKRRKKKKTNKGDLNTQAMKLASKLYHRMLNEPDFKDDDKTELWQIAVKAAKRKIGL